MCTSLRNVLVALGFSFLMRPSSFDFCTLVRVVLNSGVCLYLFLFCFFLNRETTSQRSIDTYSFGGQATFSCRYLARSTHWSGLCGFHWTRIGSNCVNDRKRRRERGQTFSYGRYSSRYLQTPRPRTRILLITSRVLKNDFNGICLCNFGHYSQSFDDCSQWDIAADRRRSHSWRFWAVSAVTSDLHDTRISHRWSPNHIPAVESASEPYAWSSHSETISYLRCSKSRPNSATGMHVFCS